MIVTSFLLFYCVSGLREPYKNKINIQMGCKDTCHIAISALLTYVVQTRIGFCKLCILVTCIIASAIASVTFTNTDGDIKYAGAGGFAFVLFATNWS